MKVPLVDIDLADGMGHLLSRDRLTVYFKRRGREKAKALIDAWKAEGVYPYPDHVWLRTKRPHDRKWLLATARAVAWLVLTKRPENIEICCLPIGKMGIPMRGSEQRPNIRHGSICGGRLRRRSALSHPGGYLLAPTR